MKKKNFRTLSMHSSVDFPNTFVNERFIHHSFVQTNCSARSNRANNNSIKTFLEGSHKRRNIVEKKKEQCILDPSAYASDFARVMRRRALGSRLGNNAEKSYKILFRICVHIHKLALNDFENLNL